MSRTAWRATTRNAKQTAMRDATQSAAKREVQYRAASDGTFRMISRDVRLYVTNATAPRASRRDVRKNEICEKPRRAI